MRAEYDIRGGERGKYFARYNTVIEIAPSPYVVLVTGTSVLSDGLTRAYWPLTIQESPKPQVGEIHGQG